MRRRQTGRTNPSLAAGSNRPEMPHYRDRVAATGGRRTGIILGSISTLEALARAAGCHDLLGNLRDGRVAVLVPARRHPSWRRSTHRPVTSGCAGTRMEKGRNSSPQAWGSVEDILRASEVKLYIDQRLIPGFSGIEAEHPGSVE